MKKIISSTFIILFFVSCSKKEETVAEGSTYDYNTKLPYDTTAIDSFSPGANPGNVIMNRVVVDSATIAKMEEKKLLAKMKKEEDDKKDKAKLEEDNKKKEAEKKKADEAAKKKKAEEKPKTETPPTQNAETTQP